MLGERKKKTRNLTTAVTPRALPQQPFQLSPQLLSARPIRSLCHRTDQANPPPPAGTERYASTSPAPPCWGGGFSLTPPLMDGCCVTLGRAAPGGGSGGLGGDASYSSMRCDSTAPRVRSWWCLNGVSPSCPSSSPHHHHHQRLLFISCDWNAARSGAPSS